MTKDHTIGQTRFWECKEERRCSFFYHGGCGQEKMRTMRIMRIRMRREKKTKMRRTSVFCVCVSSVVIITMRTSSSAVITTAVNNIKPHFGLSTSVSN